MNMTDTFTDIRLRNKKYREQLSSASACRYLHTEGWIDTAVAKELIFSHRNTAYDHHTFSEKFHTHDYYELLIFMKGDVEYLKENTVIRPAPHTVIWFNPGMMHTGRLLAPCQYERYVLYFSSDFFRFNDQNVPLTNFMNQPDGTHMVLSEKHFEMLLQILRKAEDIAASDASYAELVLKSLLVELFYLLNSMKPAIQGGEALTEEMGEIKRYIDDNYASIHSVADIANHFFYSREYLSRKFKKSFNISVAHYLCKRKIAKSLPLLETMTVADVAYTVGFHSQSAFIKAFKANMQCLPSEYKARYKNESAFLRQSPDSERKLV